MKIKELTLIVILSCLVFIQESVLSFIPGFQFTFLLFIIFSTTTNFKFTSFIVVIHILLDNLIFGFNIFVFLPMLLAYIILVITYSNLKNKNNVFYAVISLFISIIYSLCFIPFNILYLDINVITYLMADIPFTLILCCINFLIILWLYNPLSKIFKDMYMKYIDTH